MRARRGRNGAAVIDSTPSAKRARYDPAMRRGARVAAFETIFMSFFHTDADLFPITDSPSGVKCDRAYRDRILSCFAVRAAKIESAVKGALDRPFEAMGGTEKAALFAAAAELLGCPETPRAVVISETIEIARLYCDDGADKFINGVLDPVARAFAAAAAEANAALRARE